MTREIVELGIRYGLASRETSYVAIERRETPVTGDVQLRRVPIALTTGWGGLAEGALQAEPAWSVARSGSGGFLLRRASAGSLDTGLRWLPLEAEALRAEPRPMTGAFRRKPPFHEPGFAGRPAAGTAAMHALIALQRADGSWELSNALARAIGRELGPLEAVLSFITGDRTVVSAAWATTLALAWLELHAADSKDEWRLLADKARKWLAGAMEARAAGSSLVQLARRFLN